MTLHPPLFLLKRQAKQRAKNSGVPLHQALDAIAQQYGFECWGLLAARHASADPVTRLAQRIKQGDLLLLAARPLQGKTRIAFGLMAHRLRAGGHAAFFSLDYTEAQMRAQMAAVTDDASVWQQRFQWDCSDGICAATIMAVLQTAPPGCVVVIDYLQLLDQRRDQPTLVDQVKALRDFARRQQLVLVFIAQLKRAVELAPSSTPTWADVHLPNPLNASLFDRKCFVHTQRIIVQ